MTIAVNPNGTPTFAQVAPVCSGATIAALPVNSTNGINGSWSPTINNTETTAYTFIPTAGQCATTTTMIIAVNPVVAPPTGNENQTFCTGETVGDLVVNGTTVVWYDAVISGNIVTNNTLLVNGTTYYASQTTSSCQSNTRLAVTVSNGACLANENFDKFNLLLFPNPVKNILNIACEAMISKVSVYNLLGQELIDKSLNSDEGTIDTSTLPSGTYLLKVNSNNLIKTIKVIKE